MSKQISFFFFSLLFSFSSATDSDPYLLQSSSLPTLDDGSGDVDDRLLPTIGNGHVATNAFSDTAHINGVYNGRLGESHRARIRSVHASELDIQGCQDPTRTYSLAMDKGLVLEDVECTHLDVSVRLTTYAHASLDRLLVTELSFDRAGNDQGQESVTVARTDLSGEKSQDFEEATVATEGNTT